ncbi:hypothetical protein CDD82_4887 [Ophiocordyceps australis]|uniref:Uncharacterized protein n=1 Tax=Ophiocordyceps australis TaxID=1399860 RepID=A0A2C5YYA7_9HYPO|nr:hypothetical protein CDD82_4887 [Ophiocordyceps australis]
MDISSAAVPLHGSVAASDAIWNVICLSPTMHDLWTRAYFAFKCLGIYPSSESKWSVRLQFVWMPVRTRKIESFSVDEITSETFTQRLFVCQDMSHLQKSAIRAENSRPIRSGDIYGILMPFDDALKMKMAINIQWAVLRVAATSGAAEQPDLLQDPDDPDSDYQQGIRERLEFFEQLRLELEGAGDPENA